MSNEEKPVRLVKCPRCRKSTRFDAQNPFRPFCSALCKNEDIVGWAEGTYRIPIGPADEGDETDVDQAREDDE